MTTLNDKIIAHLAVSAIAHKEGDFHLGYSSEKGEHVVHWDEKTLGKMPDMAALDAAHAAHVAAQKAAEYKALRAAAYPPIEDQLDALFHAGAFPDDMAAQIQAVKDAYPKPE